MKKIIAISFALLIMLSTVGFTFTTHFCGGFIHNKTFSLGAEDLSCGMEIVHHCNATQGTINNNCCQNEFQVFKITAEFQSVVQEIAIDVQFVIAYFDAYVHAFSIEKEQLSKYINYQPPLPDRDIPVFIQSFLI